jgi:hypothetical protein
MMIKLCHTPITILAMLTPQRFLNTTRNTKMARIQFPRFRQGQDHFPVIRLGRARFDVPGVICDSFVKSVEAGYDAKREQKVFKVHKLGI